MMEATIIADYITWVHAQPHRNTQIEVPLESEDCRLDADTVREASCIEQ